MLYPMGMISKPSPKAFANTKLALSSGQGTKPLSTGSAIPKPYTPPMKIPDAIGAKMQTISYH
jgi:hypothetical protein